MVYTTIQFTDKTQERKGHPFLTNRSFLLKDSVIIITIVIIIIFIIIIIIIIIISSSSSSSGSSSSSSSSSCSSIQELQIRRQIYASMNRSYFYFIQFVFK